MDRVGGLDEYLLNSKEGKLGSAAGEKLKSVLIKRVYANQKAAAKAAAGLGREGGREQDGGWRSVGGGGGYGGRPLGEAALDGVVAARVGSRKAAAVAATATPTPELR
jgi:hypothetical protein